MGQAALEQRKSARRLAQFLEDRAEVEESEWIVGVLGVLDLQQPDISLQLPAAHGPVLVPDADVDRSLILKNPTSESIAVTPLDSSGKDAKVAS